MRKLKKTPLLLALAFLLFGLPLISAGGSAAQSSGGVVVKDHQLVVSEVDSSGNVSSVNVVNWIALDGEGKVDIERTLELTEPPRISGIRGFKTPEVTDDQMIWRNVNVSGARTMITQNKLKEDSVEPALEEIPLKVKFSYWLDDEEVEDLKDIAGKSGRFRMEVFMKNTSRKKTEVTYTDSITGEERTEKVETYLPLVIQPYDWYFDNTIFDNIKCDPTGLIFYLPTVYQIGWSIPLFPPATDASHTIWMEADVKDFQMEPLTLAIAFLFPRTNQRDPLPEFTSGLTELYGGVVQLGAGLSEAVLGLGSAGMSDTLIYGVSQISGGLSRLADPGSGLPYAERGLSGQIIPGVDQAIAGLGSAETPDTLLYGANAITSGLSQIQAAIGSPDTPDTLLYGSSAVTEGLQEVKAGIGSAKTKDTLLYAAAQVAGGLEKISAGIGAVGVGDTLLDGMNQIKLGIDNPGAGDPGIVQGLEEMLNAIGDPAAPAAGTLLYYMNLIKGFTATSPPGQMALTIGTIAGSLTEGAGGLADSVKALTGANWHLVSPTFASYASQLGSTSPPGMLFYVGAINAMISGMIDQLSVKYPEIKAGIAKIKAQLLPGVDQVSAALQDIKDAIGNADTKGTLLYGVNAMSGGLEKLKAGIGSPDTPDTLLYGTTQISGGLNQVLQGIGSAETPDTLLYGSNAVFSGLSLLKGSMSTGSMANPGLREGLVQLDEGLGEAVAGIGSAGTSNTLLWGAGQVSSGLEQLKAGLEMAVNQGTNVMQSELSANIDELNLTQGQLKAIEQRGEQFDTFLGRIDNPENAKSDVRFMIQTQPVQSSSQNSSWVIALVLSIVFGLGAIGLGVFVFRRYA